jgi:hypothetical protein
MPEKPVAIIGQTEPDWIFEEGPVFDILHGDQFTSGNISLQELTVIASLVKGHVIENALEIGTFNGRTTCNIAANMKQGGRLWTVDLPNPEFASLPLQVQGHRDYLDDEKGFIGKVRKLFHGNEYPAKIKQVWSDSAQIDPNDYPKMDFIFVDGSHSYEYCKSDSELAFNMIADWGYILWHDYNGWPGVTQALNEVYQERNLEESMFWIKDTSLTIFSFQAS